MSRGKDVGGKQGIKESVEEIEEKTFNAEREDKVFAMNRALIGAGTYNLDEFRDAVERLPPALYLPSSYYEKWLYAITTLLVEKGVCTADELQQR